MFDPASTLSQSKPARWWLTALATTVLLALVPLHSAWKEERGTASSYFREVIEGHAYDLLSTLLRPPPPDDILVVAIDEPSMAEVRQQWPWPRRLHARLIRALHAAGAKVIALDIVFAEPSNPEDDGLLAAAIRDAGNVVLAADFYSGESDKIVQFSRVEALPELADAGARMGLVTVTEPRVLRRLPDARPFQRQLEGVPDSFAQVLADRSGSTFAPPPEGALMRYFGPAKSFPRTSYYQALEPDTLLPPGTFRDKLVLVGRDLLSATDADIDRFQTPFSLLGHETSAGVEIHATAVENLRRGLAVVPLPLSTQIWALALVAFAAAFSTRNFRPLASTAGTAALMAGVVGVSGLLLHGFGLWLPPPLLLLGALLPYMVHGGAAIRRERAMRQFIAGAFSRYLSPVMVQRLQTEPDLLRLGGETRELTILFCDLRGFTAISECFKGDPQGLTRLINRYLTPMTAAILREQGTIDKYIGDAIMAFWNAPIAEPRHALNACRAALAMQEELAQVNRELAAEAHAGGTDPLVLEMGIGINTGLCLVGNLGSEQRFDYSALGDAVNLASRLEGASKGYGVRTVIGPDAAAAVADMLALLELDLIAVKGKSEAVRIYTLLGEKALLESAETQRLVAAQSAMLAAYRARDWATARRLLAEVEQAPSLRTLCALYTQRIDDYECNPPPRDWQGVYVATSK